MPNFLDEHPGRRFVVRQQSGARPRLALHLEMSGFLRSWAVPRGPSPDPAEKRLAIELERAPEGDEAVWDYGSCTAVQDPEGGYRSGKLLFELRGQKLRGVWTLVRTDGKQWLLIKETGDPHVRRGGSFAEGPVLPAQSGVDAVRAELLSLGAPRRRVAAAEVQPMLAEVQPRPFSDPEWIFELKYDGFRAIAAREGGRAVLHYRRGSEATRVYPDLAAALRALPVEHVGLDGPIWSGPRRSCPRPSSSSTCSDSRIWTCGPCRSRSASGSCASCCRTWALCGTWTTSRGVARRCSAACGSWGWRV